MRIVVFGSTGGTGRLILAEAFRRGHEVTAFARRADALAGVPGLAAVVQGDGRDQDLAVKAVSGQQAVIMTVSGRGQPGVVAAVARTVTAAMAGADVSRLVAASAYGMVATRPYVAASLVRRLFAKVFADQLAADRIIEASELDWTIARATRLTGKPAHHPARHSTAAFTKGPYSLSRTAYAAALLDLAEHGAYPRQIVNITG
jgi:putative NADH-flavin reductase